MQKCLKPFKKGIKQVFYATGKHEKEVDIMTKSSLKDNTTKKRIVQATKTVCASPTCSKRGEPQGITEFYKSNAGVLERYPICKTCISQMVNAEDLETVYPILRELNIAFVPTLWFSTIKKTTPAGALGSYLKQPGLFAYKAQGYSDSQKITPEERRSVEELIAAKYINEKKTEKDVEDKKSVTGKMVDFWGSGWKDTEYPLMQDVYDKLIKNFPAATQMHVESLKNYVIANVKYTIYSQLENTGEASKWYNMMKDAADRAKITPKQLTKADLQGGLNSFSELIQAVEQAVDVIPILPKFMMQPRDIPDFIIWSYIDYERASAGKPSPAYEEIYDFYNQKVATYIKETGDPEGLFDFIIPSQMREKIKDFIDLDK